ncbi:MAG: SirB2 family protein [Methylococcaceae bacterium]|nr:SirB2 family protein [Methylococcaceae bacterium]
MLKSLHVVLIFLSLASYIGRILLAEFKPEALHNKLSKIAPHVLNTLLIISGVALILMNGWLDGEFGWIISKFILLLVYIALGIMSMHNTGLKRWLLFAGALACFVGIFIIAITKHGFI